MSTSLRLLAVLNVRLKHISARQAARASYSLASHTSRFDALLENRTNICTRPLQNEEAMTPDIRITENWHEEFRDRGQD